MKYFVDCFFRSQHGPASTFECVNILDAYHCKRKMRAYFDYCKVTTETQGCNPVLYSR